MATTVWNRVLEKTPVRFSLWSAQTTLTVVFAWAGLMKLAFPIADLVEHMRLSSGTIHFIAVAELAAAIALDPLVTKFRPSITAFAATGLALVMALAAAYHFGRGEVAMIPVNIALGTLAAWVAWGRFAGRR
jgi:putative oxidoreductase